MDEQLLPKHTIINKPKNAKNGAKHSAEPAVITQCQPAVISANILFKHISNKSPNQTKGGQFPHMV